MGSWEHIFAGALPPSVQFNVIRRIESEGLAVPWVEEVISTPGEPQSAAVVLATNVYQLTSGGWRMVSHQGVLMSEAGGQQQSTLQ